MQTKNWSKNGVTKAIDKILIGKNRDYIDLDCNDSSEDNIQDICNWAKQKGHQTTILRNKEKQTIRIYKK